MAVAHAACSPDIIDAMVVSEVAWSAREESEVRAVEAQFLQAGRRLQLVEEDDGTFTAFYGLAELADLMPSSANVHRFGFTEASRLEAARLAWAAFVVSRNYSPARP